MATVAARPPALVLGFRTPALRAEDAAALDLLAAILARDEAGRLPRELVRNRQLADGVRPFTFHSRQGGLVALAVTPAPHRLAEAAEAAADLALRLAYEPPTAEEVARARTAVESDLAHREEGVLGRARRLGFAAAIARDRDFAEHYREELDRLGPAELQAAATKFLNADRLTVAVALPEGASVAREESAAALQPRLEAMVAGAAALAARHASARAPAVAGGDVVRFEAPSGARILVLRDKTAPLVSVEAAWGGGADEEDAAGDGAAPLLAALIDRGTRTRSAARDRDRRCARWAARSRGSPPPTRSGSGPTFCRGTSSTPCP